MVIAAAVVFVANRFAPKSETQITSSFISDKLEMVSELTTAKLTYNGLVYYSDGSIPLLTQKSFTLTYRAEVRAGVDLSQADIKITDKEVQLTLPAVRILDTVVDSDSIQFYDEKAALLNWGKKTDVLDGMTAAQKDVEEKADFDRGSATGACIHGNRSMKRWQVRCPTKSCPPWTAPATARGWHR